MPLSLAPESHALTIGLMSGTSLDGLDGVLLRWRAGDHRFDTLSRARGDFDPVLRAELLSLNTSGPDELHRAALAANRMSVDAADVVQRLLQQAGVQAQDVAAIGLHGQTVRHRPGEFDGRGYTLQLHNASLLAELSSIDVVCDFRSRDVAAGGQGAPLVPAFHADVFQEATRDVAVLNLGGIANLTLLPAHGDVGGFDCGPANVLMDLWAHQHLGRAYDDQGHWAATGRVQSALLQHWQGEAFFSKPPPKSTGRDLFNAAWLQAVDLSAYQPQDVQATLCELSAWCVDDHMARELPSAAHLWVCGGGTFNGAVMQRLEHRLRLRLGTTATVSSTQAAGMGPLDVEAAAFAWLARRFLQGQVGNVVRVTGARGPRVLGALYPSRR